MREINDQYPEYAEPYEPIKGGKHHKGIYGTRGPERRNSTKRFLFFALIGLLLLLLVSTGPGGEMAGTEPRSSDKDTVVTSETKPEEPSEPDTPEPPINPEEHKDIPEKPEEPQKPEEPVSPELPDSPDSPETSEDSPETTEPEEEPSSPTEPDLPVEPDESVYKDPTVSIAHVYYWYCLGHIEVEYNITANDGESITSYSTITSMRDPSMTVGMPSKTGAGTIDANADGYGKITYMSADEWKTDVTLAYTLNGESKTLTVSNTAQPEFMDFLWLDPQYLSGNSSTTNKVVSDTIKFRYGKNDRHTYKVSFNRIEMGWMKEVPLSGGGFTYEEVGSTRRTVWDGTGTSPITGPTGPTADGDYKVLTFDYRDLLNVVPPADAAGATHFYLDYYMKGTGTDTDGTVYTIHEPTFGRSTPCEIEKDLEVTINYIYLWDELNHIEVGYTITPGDAEDIRSVATVTSDIDPAKTVTMTEQTGSGPISVNADGSDKLWWHHSGDSWTVEVELNYTLHGENRTRTVSVSMPPEFKGNLSLYGLGVSGSGTDVDSQAVTADIVFEYPSDDRHEYDINVTGIDIGWKDKNGNKIGSTKTVWNGSDPSPVTGPTGPVIDGDWASLTFNYSGTIDATPLADAEGATQYYLICHIAGTGTDTIDPDRAVYKVHRPLSVDLASIPLPGVTLVEPEVSFDHLYWYQMVDHLELGYDITANDATNITSQAEITYDPSASDHYEHTLPEVTGAGTKTVEDNAGGHLTIFSGGQWITTITVNYELGGESKVKEFEFPGNPEFMSAYLEAVPGVMSGSIDKLNLGYEVNMVYKSDDPHSYSLDFTKVEIEWFEVDSHGNDIPVGTETIWSNSDPQVFTGPYNSGPNADGNMIQGYSFWYEGLNAAPPDPDALRFKLHFYAEINGDDVYDSPHELYTYTEKRDFPGVIVGKPEAEINFVYGWRELDHLMLNYTIIGKRATDIESYAEISGAGRTCRMDTAYGAGDVERSMNVFDPDNDINFRPLMDSGTVEITIYLKYKIDGTEMTSEFTDEKSVVSMECYLTQGDFEVSGTGGIANISCDLNLEKEWGDPHDYTLNFDRVEVFWYYADSDTSVYSEEIRSGNIDAWFVKDGDTYTYSDTINNLIPPDSDCTRYSLYFHAIAKGDDEYDIQGEGLGINLDFVTDIRELSEVYP